MNPKQKRNAIILGVLGLALVFVLYRSIFGETEQQRIYRENMAKSAAAQPTGDSSATGAPIPATAPGAATPAVKSQFQKAAVDVDQLIDSIQEVAFDYDTDRMQVNPMTPLVGPSAHVALGASATSGETPGVTAGLASDSQSVLRTFRVTGILYDKRDPMAVVSYPMKGQLTSEVVTRGFEFADMNIKVIDVEQERVILDANGTQVSLQLEER
ncbi:MAG: hypothetical protein HUU46_00900 [Candidatus Hydrogenedentes bacterium]|nr:hypothetical protein [Candidatus Hydrogenedentota bacterium]